MKRTVFITTGQRDSLLNEKKMWVDFQILENPSLRRNSFSLESPLTFCCYFIKGKPSKNKKTTMTSVWKKRSAKSRFLGLGIRLPIGKVPPMR